MRLYPLFEDRKAINILKILYNKEVVEKKSYSVKLSEIKTIMKLWKMPVSTAELLSEYELITMDKLGGDVILSITQRGKEFIEGFDQLIELFDSKTVYSFKKSIKVKYELTNQEKRILSLAYRMTKEAGQDFVDIKELTKGLFPAKNYKKKISTISRNINKLEEINLMQKKKESNKILVKITEKGFDTIREQYLKGIII